MRAKILCVDLIISNSQVKLVEFSLIEIMGMEGLAIDSYGMLKLSSFSALVWV